MQPPGYTIYPAGDLAQNYRMFGTLDLEVVTGTRLFSLLHWKLNLCSIGIIKQNSLRRWETFVDLA